MTGIGEYIECSGRLDGNAETDFPQSSDHEFPAFIVNIAHAKNVVSGLGQSGDARPLNH